MADIHPFNISVPREKIDTLQTKLSLATFPDELPSDSTSQWDQGPPLSEIQRVTEKWKTWDWRSLEDSLNEYPQFTTKIDVQGFGELDIHFLHQKSPVKNAIPLLFVHGCMMIFKLLFKIILTIIRARFLSRGPQDSPPLAKPRLHIFPTPQFPHRRPISPKFRI